MADEIKLAADTLRWLNGLKDSELPEEIRPRMRDLVANICDFQYGFSLPLDLGLSSNSPASQALPIERPIEPLLRWGYAFEVQPSEIQSFEADDHERVGDRVYCIVGGPTWESLVESGKIEGDGAEEPRLEASDWLIDLFDVFAEQGKNGSSEQKAAARRLAACWYPVAMVVSFDKVEEDSAVLSKSDIMAMMLGGLAMGDGYEDDEEDEEFGEDDEDETSHKGKNRRGDLQGDEHDGDYVPQEEGDAAGIAHEARRTALASALLAGELEDEDDDEDYDPEQDENDDGEDEDIPDEDEEAFNGMDEVADEEEEEEMDEDEETDEQRQQRAEEFRARVLSSIQTLSAQWPHIEDQAWLKRVLKLMSISDDEGQEWFPWGVPPLGPLQKSSESSDELERTHAQSILKLYADRAAVANNSTAPQ